MDNKINILLVSPFFFPTNTYQQELCQKINKLYPNINITVLCYETTSIKVEKFGDLEINYVPCFRIIRDQLVLPNYLQLIKMLKRLQSVNHFDLLMCETRFFDSAWWLPFLAKKWGVPSLIVEHCASSPKHSFILVTWIARLFDRLLMGRILNHYSAVACSNNSVLEYLKTIGTKKPHLIGTGVDSLFFNPQKRSRIEDGIVQISFASRLIYTKGPMLFYQAILPLLKKYSNLKAVIAGDGPLFEKLKDVISKDNNLDRVELIGSFSREKIASILANTDIFVYPSFHHDGIANILLEAGASGCAIVSSNSGGSAELIKTGYNGIILDDLSPSHITFAIEDLILDKKKRLIFGKALRQVIVDKYNWENVSRSLFSIMAKVVHSLSRPQ